MSVAGSAGVSVYGQTMGGVRDTHAIDAMLIDGSVAMPALLNVVIQARRQMMPVVDIQLDAANYGALRRLLIDSQTLVGVSTGATLFCLERIAWDHGFRLTARHQQSLRELDGDACHHGVATFLNGAHGSATSPSPRAYRGSRADGTLHAWTMRKSARSYVSQDRREA
ncbi:hypothetical protein [Sphingobium sp. HWE2-09]|uniref:hypothetical protein n=1 Tax=Sphingobium sp. HWE2-09 TaxID=3108390 RepID=UPI002DD35718|nr:hypothetical protein [Sphingobium sp. HWE2-09]